MATFWERAAYSFYHMFSMYFDLGILILVIFHFGFEGGTLVQIASVPGHCLSFTFALSSVPENRFSDPCFNLIRTTKPLSGFSDADADPRHCCLLPWSTCIYYILFILVAIQCLAGQATLSLIWSKPRGILCLR